MRYYSSTAVPTTLSAGINNSVTEMTVAATTGFPSTRPYTLVIDPDTASEEIVTVTDVSGTTLTITRGQDGSSATTHDPGAVVKHMVTARDLAEPQAHIGASAAVHGISGNVVGTSDTQTLTNKTLVSPTVSGSGSVTAASLSVSGSATLPASTSIGSVSSTELGYLDGVTSAVQTQLNTLTSSVADKQPLDSDLTAIAALAANGLVTRTSTGAATVRTITAGTGITVTNGDGVAGNPTIALSGTASGPVVKTGSFTVTFSGGATPSGSTTVNFSGATYSNGSFTSNPTVILQGSDARYIMSVTSRGTTSFDYSARQYEAATPTDSFTVYYVAIGS